MKHASVILAFVLFGLSGRVAHCQDLAFQASNLRGSVILNGNQWQSVTTNPPQSVYPPTGDWMQMITNPLIPAAGWVNGRVPTLPITDSGVTISAWYQTPFYLPASANVAGRRFFIDIGQIGHYGAIYINGVYAGQNFGQYVPIEVEVTGLLTFGGTNNLEVYVHNADANYARLGGIVEPSCAAPYLPNCGGASYRPASYVTPDRNWIGITGDVKIVWRPATYATVYTASSWRNQTFSAVISVSGSGAAGALARVVNSAGQTLLSLPYQVLTAGAVTLTTAWPARLPRWNVGSPQLYWLTTSIVDASGAIIDTVHTRFGPRESWVQDGTYYINGVRPVLAGDYSFEADYDPLDLTNRPDEAAFYFGNVLENSGVNTVVEHWNPLSETELEMADELGFAVVAEMYCDGSTAYQDEIDSVSGWETWMEGQAQGRVLALQNHPSVVMLRPIDVTPGGIDRLALFASVKAAAHPLDPQNLPWGDGSDIAYFSTDFTNPTTDYNPTWVDGLPASQSCAQFIKELSGATSGSASVPQWENWWGTVLSTCGNGLVAQEAYMWNSSSWTPSWTAVGGSGLGVQPASGSEMPNFQSKTWSPSPVSTAWAAYGYGFEGKTTPIQGSYLATEMSQMANSAAFLLFPGADPAGVLADSVGAQFNPLQTGTATLVWTNVGDQVSTVTVGVLSSGTGTAPTAMLSPAGLTFGNQPVGTTSSPQSVTLTNSGTAALSISGITIGQDYIQTNNCGASVAVGSNCTFSIAFAPTTTGTLNESLAITDNASGSPQSVSLTGAGTAPEVTVSPLSLTFASQLVGTSSNPQPLTLTNSGTATLTISGIVAGGDFGQTNTCGASVAAGASCTISVTFTPTAGGARTAAVTITDNASGSPQSIALTGTVTAVSLSPGSLNFGKQPVGTTGAPQTVTLTNHGAVALSIGDITFTGRDSGDFAETNTCGTRVRAGASCTISVTFTPKGKGTRTTVMAVTDNGGGSPQKVTLSGTGS